MEFLVEKIGMSRTLGEVSNAVTLLKVLPAKVVKVNAEGKSLVAYSRGKAMNKAIEGQQKAYNLSREFNKFASLVVDNKEVGEQETASLEAAVELKATFKTKGRGFTGAMKRWNFAGGPGAHGSRFHRRTGSIGNREWPGRVQKGKKMAGQYGNETVTVKCQVISFDKNAGVLVVKGSVPGANGGFGKVKVVK
ncbi:MAG: 50S ribosomal protein L3 [Campylobacteraceae bacterium]|jgi:large subunit ribosomal protein L3|nr:50S ribosomal protein L3 [Campylobacteraceae bacterium]